MYTELTVAGKYGDSKRDLAEGRLIIFEIRNKTRVFISSKNEDYKF